MRMVVLSMWVVFVLAPPVHAATDFKCFSFCLKAGYLSDYCQQQCQYLSPTEQQQQQKMQEELEKTTGKLIKKIENDTHMPQLNLDCYQDCLEKNYSNSSCTKTCTY